MRYHINIWNGKDDYLIAKCVELSAAMTQGKTKAEVLDNMKEAIALVLADIKTEAREKQAQLVTVEA